MKTGQDVREGGLYVSDCCLQERTFSENDSFVRCPRCLRLCEWDLVDAPVWPGGPELGAGESHEAA
jgi:hypothetical protein